MKTTSLAAFHTIGITIRTTNKEGASGTDIPNLWNAFMKNSIAAKIQNKIDNTIYCIYTDYEGDHTQPYSTFLGCKVTSLDHIPEGCIGMSFNAATYQKFTTNGDLTKGIIWKEWENIWAKDLERTFIADFEVYDERAIHPDNAVVDIFVGVK